MEEIFAGLFDFLTIGNLALVNLGIFAGVLFGAIPGLNANIAMVLFLPMTVSWDPMSAIIFLLGIFTGGKFGGAITAVLIGVPGTNAAAATMLDGYPMALGGHARKGVQVALWSSTVGSFLSAIVLLIATPLLGKLALLFGPPEYFLLGIMGLVVIAAICDDIFAGIMMGGIGFFFSTVGMDTISGAKRFVFGNVYLLSGVPLVAMLIGMFALANVMEKMTTKAYDPKEYHMAKIDKKDNLSLREMKQLLPTVLKSTAIGTLIGAMPGAGANIAAYLAYASAKRSSKTPEKFGTGVMEGVAAPEAGNSAVSGSSLIPMLTLGVPGAPACATLMVAFQMHGLACGPTLMAKHSTEVYIIIIATIVIALFMYLQCSLMMNLFGSLAVMPQKYLICCLPLICIAGIYSTRFQLIDLTIMVAFALFGYVAKRFFNLSAAPMILGYILGPISDTNLRNALTMSQNSLTIFFKRPICLILIAFIIVFVVLMTKPKKSEGQTA